MISALLASGASLAWGSADFLAGVGSRRLGLMTVLLGAQMIGMVLFLPVLAIAGHPPPALSYWVLAAVAGGLNASALTAFYAGLVRGPISLVASIAATETVIPVSYGLMHGERLSLGTAVGVALAMIGIGLAAGLGPGSKAREEGRSSAPAAALGLIAAICFGLFVVAMKGASSGGALWAVAFSRLTTIGLLAAVMPLMRTKFSLGRRHVSALLAIGGLDVAACTLLALATTSGPIGVVGVLSSCYPVVTILLAGLVLRERLGPLQRLGTVGTIVGVALITVR